MNFPRLRPLPRLLALASLAVFSASACDGGESKAEGDADEKAASADDEEEGGKDEAAAKGDATDDSDDDIGEKAIAQAKEEANAERFFDPEDKAFRKRSCEFLSADDVSTALAVPAAELKQTKMMGCIYSWRKDGQIADAQLMMLMTHKDVDRAKLWFGNATKSKTKEELDAEMEMVKQKALEREEIDTKLKKKTTNDIGEMMKMAMPTEGVTWEDGPGVGDEARISSADGLLKVRMGNLTFQISAYKGADMPEVPFDPKNIQGMAKKSIEIQKKWIKDTVAERKEAATKIAPGVVQAIDEARG